VSSRRLWVFLALLPASLILRPTPSAVAPLVALPGGVEVTPDAAGPEYPEANTTGHQVGFWVKNTRTVTTTYAIACGVSGGATSCTPDASQVTLLTNQMIDVYVTYATGAASSGKLILRASGAAADTGYYNLTVLGQGSPGVALKNQNDNNKDRSSCLVAGAGEAAWQCGDLLVSHGMPGYSTMGRERSLALVYNSAQAVPQPVVTANITNGDIALPVGVYAELRVGTTGGSQVRRDSTTFSGWNLDATPRQIALTFDASDTTLFPTGAYPFTLEVRNQYPTTYSTTRTGTLLIVNRIGSEFGAGWSLGGVERLYFAQPVGTSNGDILWVGGEGSAKLYKKLDATHWAAPRGVLQDTIIYNSGTTEYTRTLRHKIQVVFNTTGRHIRTVNRFEQATQFYYASAGTGVLDSIWVPPDTLTRQTYRLKYASGKIDSLVDPAGRGLDITMSSSRITSITDPDGIATSFGYDGTTARMLTRTNRRNFRTRFEYINNLRLTKVFVPGGPTGTDTSTTEFKPWDEKGLATAAAPDSGVYTTILGPRVSIPDDARIWVDQWGAPVKIINAIGATTLLTRGDTTVPQLVTRVDYPNGRVGLMTYDARGNLTQARDSTWYLGTTLRDSTRFSTYQYSDPDAPDSPSRTGDSYNRYTYFYYGTMGITDSTVDPRTLTTGYYYRTAGVYQGLMDSVVAKAVTVWRESDSSAITVGLNSSFTYDALGIVRTMTTPAGNVTTYKTDTYGRTTDVYDPMGGRSSYVYDALNRTLRSYQHTPKFTHPYSVTQSCETNQLFCDDSTWIFSPALADSLGSTFKLGAMTLDTVTDSRGVKRSFGYDAQGLQRIEQDEFSNQKLAYYDRAGLLDSILTRDNIKIRFKNDTLGRRTSMSFPQRSGTFGGDGTIVPGDTVTYTYDLMGNQLTAKNRWNTAPITRTYYANGALKTQRTSSDSLYFEYDRNGQRRRMIRNNKDTLDYSYGTTTGDLQSITAKLHIIGAARYLMTFSLSYDNLGRRIQVTYPGSIVVTLAYDKNGTLRQLKSTNGATPTGTDRFDFKWRNRDVDAAGRILRQTVICSAYNVTDPNEVPCGDGNVTTVNRYNRLGMMVSQTNDTGTPPDSLSYDGSGNLLFRKQGATGERDSMFMTANSNRLATDRINAGVIVTHSYNLEGARLKEQPSDSSQFQLWKWYYYDGLGRLSGSRYATWEQLSGNNVIVVHQNADYCRYDADGQMVLACDNNSPALYLDGPNAVGNSFAWGFVQGPGTDDPLVAFKRISGGIYDGTFQRILFYVTDGSGRQYAVGDSSGLILPGDLATGDLGWKFSGATGGSNGLGAARMSNATIPGVSYFRNRAYDSRTGRWTQEDPIGLAGGMNMYQFNGNNPASFTDPFGLCQQGTAEPKCKSRDEAAKKAMSSIYQASLADNQERGGEIVALGKGRYVYAPPRGGDVSGFELHANVPGYDGYYHSHGAKDPNYLSEEFSSCSPPTSCDKSVADKYQKPGYLVTPSGRMLRYDPDPKKQQNGKTTDIGSTKD
jgi:RHS repeat-associated protein